MTCKKTILDLTQPNCSSIIEIITFSGNRIIERTELIDYLNYMERVKKLELKKLNDILQVRK
jgi:hypothetical protein